MQRRHIVRVRRTAGLLLLGSGIGLAQSASLPGAAPRAVQLPARPAEVVYSKGKFVITANNSSLRQILDEMARRTGMQITGSVSDERVYGMYGPEALAGMLEILLDGTGTNMMLSGNGVDSPAQLMLSARQGGPTPPQPHVEEPDSPEAATAPEEPPAAPAPRVPANRIPPGTGDSGAPDGMLTPQQRFALIQQLQQQQGTAQPASAGPQANQH